MRNGNDPSLEKMTEEAKRKAALLAVGRELKRILSKARWHARQLENLELEKKRLDEVCQWLAQVVSPEVVGDTNTQNN